MNIILASTSEVRQKILASAGLKFEVCDPAIDETAVKGQNSSPEFVAIELAKRKSETASRRFSNTIAIGADQTLGFQDRLFSKPNSKLEARQQLLELRGNTHFLYSALSCSINGRQVWNDCPKAELKMRNFSDEFLEEHLIGDSDAYLGSVGGYKIEKTGIQLFEEISGDYFTILGLPLLPLLEFLRQKKIIPS